MKNYKEMCADCACLVAGDNNEWICDEAEKPCKDVVNCPEGEMDDYTVIWGFTTGHKYSVIMPTENSLIFCGFCESKNDAEALAKSIQGIVLHDTRFAK